MLVGTSLPMRRLFISMGRLAEVELPVLILGETGTGKTAIAAAMHTLPILVVAADAVDEGDVLSINTRTAYLARTSTPESLVTAPMVRNTRVISGFVWIACCFGRAGGRVVAVPGRAHPLCLVGVSRRLCTS